jgi:ribosome-associated heat shock protein Hsp15
MGSNATLDRVWRHNQCMESQTFSVRLDVWLWAARFFKTRQLAKQAVDGGKVECNGAAGKPAKLVREGDTLHIARALERFEVSVLAVSEKRGPAAVAQSLYCETAASIAARAAVREQRRLTGGPAPHPDGRPDKHARRQLQRINKREGDALPPWFPK